MPEPTPAIFLDRDGVIDVDRDDYVKSWEEFRFADNALEGLRILAELPLPILVVTNQSPVGREIITRARLDDIHEQMLGVIRAHGGRVDRIYVCPHTPWSGCSCRKPGPGLLLQAQAELGLDLARSWLIGDRASDIQAGKAAGVRTILLAASGMDHCGASPDHVARDLAEAAHWLRRRLVPLEGLGS